MFYVNKINLYLQLSMKRVDLFNNNNNNNYYYYRH